MTAHPVLPPAALIMAEMERAVTGVPETAVSLQTASAPPWANLIVDLVESNLRQWDLEDTTRDPGATDAEVASAKREIDRLNMGRHRLVQQIDAAIDSVLDQPATAPIATESPGMVLDRLSVLVIRRARTAAASARHSTFSDRMTTLESQLAGLSTALDFYMDELRAGSRRFLRYEPLKLYGPSPSAAGSKESRR
jgi:hypothetical protein